MTPSEDLKSYADGMFQDVKDNRNYKAGDVYAVAGYIKRKANEVAKLEAENERLPEYRALANLIGKYRLVYEDGHSGDGIIAFDDAELAQSIVNLADALLTKDD